MEFDRNNKFALHQSLPCARGGGSRQAAGGVVAGKCSEFASDFGEYGYNAAQSLSQKSEDF